MKNLEIFQIVIVLIKLFYYLLFFYITYYIALISLVYFFLFFIFYFCENIKLLITSMLIYKYFNLITLEEKKMNIIITIFTHLLIIFGLGSMGYFIFRLIMEDGNQKERLTRIIALLIGLMIYILSKFTGQDYITTLFSSYMDSTGGAITQIIKLVAPFLVGYFVSSFIYKKLKSKDEKQSIYMLIVISTLIFFAFIDMYFGSDWTDIKKSNIIANASFVLGIMVMFVFGKHNIQDTLEDNLGFLKKESTKSSAEKSENNNADIPNL